MVDPNEADRLRALLAVMRESGVTRLVTPDGFVLERPARSPIEEAIAARANASTTAKSTTDDDEDLDGEEEAEKATAERWNEFWSRATRSSGAPVPRFPGVEKAAAFLRRHSL